jgi:hypothetical protein
MKGFVKLLIAVGFAASLAGCVVVPAGRHARAYGAVPGPVVVVHPYGYAYHRW